MNWTDWAILALIAIAAIWQAFSFFDRRREKSLQEFTEQHDEAPVARARLRSVPKTQRPMDVDWEEF